jgi:NAD(P)-dependent dehydrogenase (short-subunit alcohol dehydrogenase family)
LLLADLSSQSEVHRLAEDLLARFPRLDVLVNNVAGIYRHRQETVDGIEATFALGHLAPFLLTHLLQPLPIASQPARIINLVSDGHSMATLDFDDLGARQSYRGLDMYLRAKLANVLFTYELARRLEGSGVTVNAVEPGGARTQLIDSTTSDMLPPALKLLFPLIKRFGLSSIEEAAQSSIYAAAAPEMQSVSGKYINAKGKQGKSSKTSYDHDLAARLWRVSEEMVGINAGVTV